MLDSRIDRETVLVYSIEIYVRLAIITIFAYFSLRLLSPFISILAWATILAVALYPIFLWLIEKLGCKASLAATLIALVSLVVLLYPTIFIVDSLLDSLSHWSNLAKSGQLPVPLPPESVKDWPLVGNKIHEVWNGIALNLEATVRKYEPQIQHAIAALLRAGGGLALGVLQFALSIILAAIFLCYAKPLTAGLERLFEKFENKRGPKFVAMARATINSVARGVLGVALIQGALGSIGVFVGGFPFPGVIAALIIMLCIVQMPPLAFLPLIIYAWSVKSATFALIFTIYMLACMFLDNVLKPILLGRGLSTPTIVILIGVIGGTLKAGMLGLFIGPVILAIFYEIITVWVRGPSEDDVETVTAEVAGESTSSTEQ